MEAVADDVQITDEQVVAALSYSDVSSVGGLFTCVTSNNAAAYFAGSHKLNKFHI